MGKQRMLDFSMEADFDADFESSFDQEFENDFEDELHDLGEQEPELQESGGAELTPPVVLTPEQILNQLLALGRTQGFVSYDDVLGLVPEAENNMEQVEDIFASLFEHGIEVGQVREE